MAVKHGYAVVPFASVGLEDAVSIAFGFDVTWIARKAEPGRGPLRLPILLPYNSLQRQVIVEEANGRNVGVTRKTERFRALADDRL